MCSKYRARRGYAFLEAFFHAEQARNLETTGDADEEIFRVMNIVHMMVWNKETQQRQMLDARWDFPHRSDWRRPDPVHARSETIDEK